MGSAATGYTLVNCNGYSGTAGQYTIIILIIVAVISIAPYLTDKDEHTALYTISNSVYTGAQN